ncbi:carboxypeptidase-like regulatory domain-containing protein [Luteimonas lutimaris]|uniref:Carboxypeptidase regulatory-like domain-containing protein n=1 Tax=Luteimonas lutimaris TaxID=698645 RepID=A0ABP7M8D7_9GAMM
MTKTSLLLLAVLALPGLAACEGSKAADAAGPESGYATGTVVDTAGNPIAGAKILLDNSVFYASYIHGSTRDDGSYRIRVQPGAWRVHATFRKDYNGRTYTLELHPDAIDSIDQDGGVRNFTWQLEGRGPVNDYSYYGGFIQLSSAVGFYEDFNDVELVLTPDGPLIDGSPGQQLRLRLNDHYWRDYYQIEDIPIGRYTVTATLESDGQTRPLSIQDWHGKSDPTPEFQLDFLPESGGSPGAKASIVIGD